MKEKKKFSFRSFFVNSPIITTICIMLLFGDIVWLTYLVTSRINHKEMRELRNSNNELNKSKAALNDLYEKLMINYNQVNDKCNRLDTMYKELERKSQELQSILDPRISSLTSDLNTCQNKNLEFITAMANKDSTIASQENRLHDYEQSLGLMEKLFVQQMALEPTWIKAGQVFTAFNNDVAIVVDEASGKNRCPRGSAATVRLNIGKDKKNLCLQMDHQEVFTYKGKKYFFSLLEVRENDQAHEYLVSILKEKSKSLN
ncbi:MAG: hypothetical protein ACLQDI_15290 [Syntrophobacteraceae bacterium]